MIGKTVEKMVGQSVEKAVERVAVESVAWADGGGGDWGQ